MTLEMYFFNNNGLLLFETTTFNERIIKEDGDLFGALVVSLLNYNKTREYNNNTQLFINQFKIYFTKNRDIKVKDLNNEYNIKCFYDKKRKIHCLTIYDKKINNPHKIKNIFDNVSKIIYLKGINKKEGVFLDKKDKKSIKNIFRYYYNKSIK